MTHGQAPLTTLPVPQRRVFCLTISREAVATCDHTGRLTCNACGERVQPVVTRRHAR